MHFRDFAQMWIQFVFQRLLKWYYAKRPQNLEFYPHDDKMTISQIFYPYLFQFSLEGFFQQKCLYL